MTLRACIHRGADQVGGTCVELECDGQRLLLDLGMPLDAEDGEVPLPAVSGLAERDPTLLGVIISHLHGDHCGLVPYATPGVPVAIGPVAARILREAEFFTGRPPLPDPRWTLVDQRPFSVGPFRITPYQVEHSAPDAFALLIEAGGRRLLYSGDFRAHGNDRGPFARLLRDGPRQVNAVLLEGTQVGDGREGDGPGEDRLRGALARRFRETPGLVLAAWSSQNLDRMRTVYDAARDANRALVVDLYTATLATAPADAGAGGAARVPRLGDPALMVCCRERERRQVKAAGQFYRTNAVWRWRIKRELLARRGRELVVMLRPSMVDELDRAGALQGALAVWSMWSGYLEQPAERRMRERLDSRGARLEVHHVSGHAYVCDLQRLVAALSPERVIPVHTEGAAKYPALFPRVDLRRDGEWWEV